MIVRIDEEGNITGFEYKDEDSGDIAPFEPVGATTFVVDACTRKVFTVEPGVATENKEAGDVCFMLGKDQHDNQVLIAYDPQFSNNGAHRGVVIPSDDWVVTPAFNHLMRCFSTKEEAEQEASKTLSVSQVEEDNGWKGVVAAGNLECLFRESRFSFEPCATLLLETIGLPKIDGLHLQHLVGQGGTVLVIATKAQPFPEEEHESPMDQSTLLDVTISPKDTSVTLTVVHGNKEIVYIVQRTFSYEEAKRHLTL